MLVTMAVGKRPTIPWIVRIRSATFRAVAFDTRGVRAEDFDLDRLRSTGKIADHIL